MNIDPTALTILALGLGLSALTYAAAFALDVWTRHLSKPKPHAAFYLLALPREPVNIWHANAMAVGLFPYGGPEANHDLHFDAAGSPPAFLALASPTMVSRVRANRQKPGHGLIAVAHIRMNPPRPVFLPGEILRLQFMCDPWPVTA